MTEPTQSVALIQKDITDDVNIALTKLQEEGLALPTNYNYSNALKSAFFALSNNAGGNLLEICSKASIANALLDMVTQGLSPAKTQCYFINYNKTCKLNRSYFGTQAVLKRLGGVEDIWANVIYKDDVFKYENDRGREKLISHETSFENRDKEILGAYAIVKTDEEEIMTVMTKKEIDASWSQSKTQQAVHKKFPGEMSKRTVINRAAKAFINTSDDSDLLVESINNTTENEFDERERKEINPEAEIRENANTEFLDMKVEPLKEEKTSVDQSTGEIISEPLVHPEPVTTNGPGF